MKLIREGTKKVARKFEKNVVRGGGLIRPAPPLHYVEKCKHNTVTFRKQRRQQTMAR